MRDETTHDEPACDSCGALPGTEHGTRCFYRWVQTETAQAEEFLRLTVHPGLHFVQSGPGGTWKAYRTGERDAFGPLVARGQTLPELLNRLSASIATPEVPRV
jgi:hypothetical protein